ncbi:MAG: sugar kinase [Defluviitaleaceae bacterium]|nr:sugar kinase [Defluviitaleaceae bacterium]
MKIWTMGEILVEIMRPKPNMPLDKTGVFMGPYPSGAPAIFIDTVARLGHQAGIIGCVGNDDFGSNCLTRLEKDGVDTSMIKVVKNGSTAAAFVTYNDIGERSFIFHINNTPAVTAKCPNIEYLSFPTPEYFHIMGCSLMADDNLYQEIINTTKMLLRAGVKISFDPNIRPELLKGRNLVKMLAPIIHNCSVLLPGYEELLAISSKPDMESAVATLFENPVLEIIAVKLGSKGCRIFTRDEDFSLGVYPITPIDPTGAGDCFDAGFLCGLMDGLSLEETAKQASAAAALNTAAFGPMEGNISPKTIKEFMATNANLTDPTQ